MSNVMPLCADSTNLSGVWPEVLAVFAKAQAASMYCSVASVSEEGIPTVTPIGTVFLGAPCSGIYFDRFTEQLAANVQASGLICVMAVNAGKLFWLKSLLVGRFASSPGVRLYGTAGPLREATREEAALAVARVGAARWSKGGRALWSEFTHVRDLRFTSFRAITYPVMCERFGKEAHNPSIERTD